MTTPQEVYAAVFDFLSRHGRAPLVIPVSALTPEPQPVTLGSTDEDRRRRRAVGDKDDTPQSIKPAWLVFSMPPPSPPPDLPPSPVPPPAPIITPPTHIPGPGGGPGGGIAGMGFFPMPLFPDLTQRLAQPVIVAPVDRESFEDYFSNQTIESFWRLPAGSSVTEDETGSTMTTGSRMMIDKRSFTDCTATLRLGTVEPESQDTLLVRATLSGLLNGYGLRQIEASGAMQLLRFDAGIETILNTYPGENFAPGDTMTLKAESGDLSVFHNGVGVDTAFDATYTDGYVGIYTPGLTASTATYFAVEPV